MRQNSVGHVSVEGRVGQVDRERHEDPQRPQARAQRCTILKREKYKIEQNLDIRIRLA